MEDYLMHYGRGHENGGHSGRYPWGSGEDPYQHDSDFLNAYHKMKSEGLSEKEIADGFGISINDLRARYSNEVNSAKADRIARAQQLRKDGYSYAAIGKMLGTEENPINESTVRTWLKTDQLTRTNATQNAADFLREQVEEKGIIDIGKGTNLEMLELGEAGISATRMKNAVDILKQEGYEVKNVYIPNASDPSKKTTVQVLAKEGVDWKEVNMNPSLIKNINDYIEDNGAGPTRILASPESISSNRIKIRYEEEGGIDRDGVIELRRGVDDISLGNSNYAQVRIAVDGTHYMKGMAIYSDDLPDGVDILFNTNKHIGTPITKVLKPLKDDPDNPFGATIKADGQTYYESDKGKYVKVNNKYILDDGSHKDLPHFGLSVANKIKSEGDWEEYSKSLSSQFLSKQKKELVDKQINLSIANKQLEYNDILAVTNPTVRKYLLKEFSDSCDSAAVDLKTAALPRQSSKVILPVYDIPDGQVYAPTYRNGEKVVLIRYPHGGVFEIPELTVNNNWPSGKKIVGPKSIDAIGINKKTADQLSGADFDGDTVVVIPVNKNVRVTTKSPLKELKNFSTTEEYPGYPGMKKMTARMKKIEMGKISNLITDMTFQGATEEELARAVKHSMVVIDAEKHGLNYKKSEQDNRIDELRQSYQKHNDGSGKYGGASTLISKSKSEARIPEISRQDIDPKTGEIKNIYSGRMKYVTKKVTDENGKTVKKLVLNEDGTPKLEKVMTKTTKMAITNDARTLSSGTRIEESYAKYANTLKRMANDARKDYVNTSSYDLNTSAAKTYANEVASLKAKLNNALKSHPKERKAQIIARQEVLLMKKANPDMTTDELKKASTQAIAVARTRIGSKKDKVNVTDREWEAIQAKALNSTTVSEILKNMDSKQLKQMAMPRESKSMSNAQISRIKALRNSGFTIQEIADDLNLSSSTISKYINQ